MHGQLKMPDNPRPVEHNLYGCQPTAAQEMLLHAALDTDQGAVEAWHAWRRCVSIEDVDPASYRLLPLAYKTLSALGVDDHPMDKLKGVYRHTWIKNQTLYRSAGDVIQLLAAEGIPSLLLKGAALAAQYYGDDGTRSMQDIDLLVPPESFRQAAGLLMASGWEPFASSPRAVDWYHVSGFKHGCGLRKQGIEVDLHTQLFRFISQGTDELWQAAESWEWRGHPSYRLCDTDQLFHTCVHGVRWSYGFLSWIPDALAILRHPDVDIDWERLLRTATVTRSSAYLVNSLAYLANTFAAPVPRNALSQLRDLPTGWVERQEYRTLASDHPNRPWIAAPRVLLLASRYRAARAGREGPIAFSLTAWLHFLYVHLRGLLL